MAGAALAAPTPGASAAGVIAVDCSTTNLQTAIGNASPGAKLAVTGTCFGSFTIDKDLSVLGQGTAVLDGQHAVTPLVILSGATVRVANLTITDGTASYPPPHEHCGFCVYGGGINNAGTLTLDQSMVTDNNSEGGAAGGIFNGPGAVLTLNDTTVSGNASLDGGGIVSDGTMTLEGSGVRDNNGGGGGVGGGISSNSFSAVLTLKDTTVSGNTAGSGGGINNIGTMTLEDSGVSDNTAIGVGGGIDNTHSRLAPVTLKDTTISDNTAGSGGGINNVVATNMTLKDTTISDNTATGEGGGIMNNSAAITLDDGVVTSNTAGSGGGIFDFSAASDVSLNNSTVRGNIPDNCDVVFNPPGSVPGCTG
jgi:hypothetical protein